MSVPLTSPSRSLEADLLDVVLAATYLDAHCVLLRLLECAVRVTGATSARLTLVHWAEAPEAVLTAGRPEMSTSPPRDTFVAQVSAQVRGVPVGTVEMVREHPFTEEDHARLGVLAGTIAHVVDHSRSADTGERRRRMLEASAELSQDVGPPLDTAAALDRICNVARAISEAVTSTALQWTPDGPAVLAATGVDGRSRDWVNTVLADVVDRLRPRPGTVGVQHLSAPDHRALCLPINSRVASPAVLVLVYAGRAAAPGPDAVAALETLADQAALVLDRLQAVTDQADRHAAAARERHARELHDMVLQRLFATGLQLQGVRSAVAEPDARTRIDLTIELVDETMRRLREAAFPPGLLGTGVSPDRT